MKAAQEYELLELADVESLPVFTPLIPFVMLNKTV